MTNAVSGITYLATDANVGAGATLPDGFTIGTAGNANAALVVDNTQMNTVNGNAFRSIGPNTALVSWRMHRSSGEIGRLYGINTTSGTGSIANSFNIQQMVQGVYEPPSNVSVSLWMRNGHDNGIRLIDDVAMDLTASGTTVSYTNVPRIGYVGIGNAGNMGASTTGSNTYSALPWSRLHLIGGDAHASYGYRSWMRNGVMMTGNSSQMYVGPMHMSDAGLNHGAIQFSNSGTLGSNRQTLRFIHTTGETTSGTGSEHEHGMEFMRMWPDTYSEPFIGVGNFNTSGAGNPTERLDVLNGNVRIRGLASASDTRIVTADANGVLHYRDATSGDCEWNMTSTVSNPNHVYTAYGTSSTTCPDVDDLVGIGTNTPAAKLDVLHSVSGSSLSAYASEFEAVGTLSTVGGTKAAVRAIVSGTADGHRAVDAQAVNGTEENIAVHAVANHGTGDHANSYGVKSYVRVFDPATCTEVYGVHAYVQPANTDEAYGLYADMQTTDDAAIVHAVHGEVLIEDHYAAYFVGPAFCTAEDWAPSDENLKTNIADASINAVSEALEALSLHTYEFNQAAAPTMMLPSGQKLGLLASEVEAVLPGLVKSTIHPAKRDSLGNIIADAVPFKAMNMEGLIPYLIGGHQAQQATIAGLQAQVAAQQEAIEQMQEVLAGCCAGGMAPGDGGERIDGLGSNEETILGNTRALTIQPNPFNEATTLYYTLERAGRMQLLANSADGKQLKVLDEAQREAGQYQREWNTTDLSPGVYYITLLLDGEPVVKKAVKVQR